MKSNIKAVLITLLFLLLIALNGFTQCDYTQGTISVSTSGFENGAGYTQTYVLVSDTSDQITDIQPTGTFNNVTSGAYRIYAVNYNGSTPSILAIDSLWTTVHSYDTTSTNCFDAIGPKDGVITVCEPVCFRDSSIQVSTGGFEDTTSTDYSQQYVLVNSNDSIYASNSTGLFSFSDYRDSGVFEIYAVNTSNNAVRNEIADGGLWADVESIESSTCTEYIGARLFRISNSYCSAPLPISFSIEGKKLEETNLISWSHPNASNIDYFEIYSGTSINNLSKTGRLKNNNDAWNPDFTYTDDAPSLITFYKVRAVDRNGNYHQSNIIVLEREINTLEITSLFPNPTKNRLNISISSSEKQNIELIIADTYGKTVIRQGYVITNGYNSIPLEANQLSSGMYHIHIVSTKQRISSRFIKEH